MFQFFKRPGIFFLAVCILGMSAVGCHGIYSDQPGPDAAFQKDATFDWVGTTRKKDENIEPFGYSNKARAIEQNLGG